MAWCRVAKRAKWSCFEAVRRDFHSSDQVGSLLIFNLRGNAYRLIARIVYATGRLCIKALLSHAEYDTKGWMQWNS